MLANNVLLDIVLAKQTLPRHHIHHCFTLIAHLLFVTKTDTEIALRTINFSIIIVPVNNNNDIDSIIFINILLGSRNIFCHFNHLTFTN